jgi:hypothetical protein
VGLSVDLSAGRRAPGSSTSGVLQLDIDDNVVHDSDGKVLDKVGAAAPSLALGGEAAHARVRQPPFSYSGLIEMAIEAAPTKRLMLNEIYEWIMDNFKYYKYSTKNWKARAGPPRWDGQT